MHFWSCKIPNLLLICWGLLCPQIRNSPMSSTPSATDLRPDWLLRSLLLVIASVLHLAGLVLLLVMPLSPGICALMIVAWSWLCVHEWRSQLRAYRRVTAIRIQVTGRIETIGPGGAAEPVRLLGGSLVLPGIAWLRLEFADHSHYGELLAGDRSRCASRHWLQLSWRQHGPRFGQPDRS